MYSVCIYACMHDISHKVLLVVKSVSQSVSCLVCKSEMLPGPEQMMLGLAVVARVLRAAVRGRVDELGCLWTGVGDGW